MLDAGDDCVGYLSGVEIDYPSRPSLGPFDLIVGFDEIIAVVGASGAGKSTLLQLLAGLEKASGGAVARAPAKGRTGFVFQNPTLMPWADALTNVALPLELSGMAGPEAHRRATEALAAVAFFPVFSGVLTGLKAADPDLERLFDLYGVFRFQRLWRLRLPTAVPFALEGLRVASGLAVIGAVVAEFVSGSGAAQGLAWRLLEAGNRLRTAELLAALVCLAILGLLLNAAVAAFEREILRRRSGR